MFIEKSSKSYYTHFCQRFRCSELKYSSKNAQSMNLNYPLMEMVTESNQMDVLEDMITPLARTPYDSQIIFKDGIVRNFLKNLRTSSVAAYHVVILPTERSPVINHYRHKDEFNFRIGLDGDPKTLGFFTGRPQFGQIYAIRPTNLINVKEEHKLVGKVFEDFVRESPLSPCYVLNDGGYWRKIVLRSNLKNDIMAIVTAHPRDRNPDDIEKEKSDLKQHFLNNGIDLCSLYHQLSEHVKSTPDNSITSLVHGKPYIYESFLSNEFRLSPDSFFQINVKAAEIMHQEVAKLAKFTSSTTLLDLYCGVGTFSISFSKDVRNCIGIECNRSSIDDALANCKINNVHNCEFTFGRVEEKTKQMDMICFLCDIQKCISREFTNRLNAVLTTMSDASNIVVVVNPGRSGLHPRVIYLLRENPIINRIVYVSCDPENKFTKRNFYYLLKSGKNIKGKPFILKRLKPIDMFPHTFHYELILLFERQ